MKNYYYNNSNFIKLYNADCIELMQRLINKGIHVDAIITDPPYGYLDHKLDKKFDNHKFFELAYKLIKQNGFLIFFGRGVENAKRIVIADQVGFKFKEEIVWNKKNISFFAHKLLRTHEMIYVFAKGSGTINRVHKDCTDEIFNYNYESYIKILENDIKRIISGINNIQTYEDFMKWKNGGDYNKKSKINVFGEYKIKDSKYSNYKKYNDGAVLKSIISVASRINNKHAQIHPTEKPVKLMEILIELVDDGSNDFTVLDPFAGSCATGVACYNLNKNFIGCEIDGGYFNAAVNRIKKEYPQKLF